MAVVIGSGISGSPIQQVQLRIIGSGAPCASAAGASHVFSPGFRTGLARTRNGPHTPEALAGFRVVGVKETPNPYVASGHSDNDFPVEHSRRPVHCVALAILVNVDSPFHRACGGVKRDEM